MILVKDGKEDFIQDRLAQQGFAIGETDQAQLQIQGQVEIYSQGAGWGWWMENDYEEAPRLERVLPKASQGDKMWKVEDEELRQIWRMIRCLR